MPDGTLLQLRDTYPIETAWAPQWTGEELRQIRLAAADARLAAIRAAAEARAARRQGRDEKASQQQSLAASHSAVHDAYRQRAAVFAAVMADRQQWEQATRQQRQLVIAADAELRRRHPGQQFPLLRSAEPESATQQEREELTLTAGNRRSPPGPARTRTRSSGRSNPRSSRRHGSWNASPAATWTWKPPNDR